MVLLFCAQQETFPYKGMEEKRKKYNDGERLSEGGLLYGHYNGGFTCFGSATPTLMCPHNLCADNITY